jgi:MoxR-like ATPase
MSIREQGGEELRRKAIAVVNEVRKVIIGKDEVIVKVLLAILSRGHILLEDIPGVGKTTMAVALSAAMNLRYNRIQFTPEVMPADVVGYSAFDAQTGALSFRPGAALCNLLLVDEINRASSKTQSALLEAMEENAVTVDGVTHRIEPPYTVIATQNPAGSAGTQLLPESQMDRFMVRLSIGYPSIDDEVSILRRRRGEHSLAEVARAANADDIREMQNRADEVYVDEDIYVYIARIVDATRQSPLLRLGASPRASIALLCVSRAAAWLSGRDYVIPQDIDKVLFDVLEHRVSLDARTDVNDGTLRDVIVEIVKKVPRPQIVRQQGAAGRRNVG